MNHEDLEINCESTSDMTPEEELRLRLAEKTYNSSPVQKMTMTERLAWAGYTGGRLFKTGEEVDAFIREERDSWER